METLDFYFDFLSPYAYFASKRVEAFCEAEALELRWRPVPLGVLLHHWGHLGPAEIPPKRIHTFRDCLIYAKKHGLAFGIPAKHPFSSITALRCVLLEEHEDQSTAVHALYDAGWRDGVDLGDPAQLAAALSGAGLDGQKIVEMTQTAEVKNVLRANSERAIEAGVFGVPSFVVRGELFWGNDQFENISDFLENGPLVDEALLERLLATPSGIERKH